MLYLPPELIAEKNELYTTGAMLELLEVRMADGQTMRLANNAADVIWGGQVWQKFAFDGGDQTENSDGEVPDVTIRVCNAARDAAGKTVEDYLEETVNGLVGDTVIYRQVHAAHLSEQAVLEAIFTNMQAQADDQWVTFNLGAENFFLGRFPGNIYRRDVCRYKPWQTGVCAYVNNPACDRRFGTCIDLGQSAVYGGQPGIPGGAFDV